MTIIAYTFLLLYLWAFPIYISYKYLRTDQSKSMSFINILKLSCSFLVSVFLIKYVIKYYFILFFIGPVFTLIGYINYRLNSDKNSNFIHLSLAVDLSFLLLFLLMFFSTLFGLITNESAIFFMFYGLKTVSVLLLLVFVIGIGVMAWLYKKILPPLQQISNKTTKHHLLILNAVKISYSSLVVVFLQENLSTFKGDVYIIIIIAIILGLFLNHYLFSSLLDYIRLTVDSDNLTILQDHLTSDRIRKDDLNQMEQNIQSLRHDLKQLANHFESLDRDSDSYQQMLSELNEEIDKNTKDQINFSDHELLNTYLYNFNKLCLKSHIDFKCLLIWDITNIDPFESIRLFSNLLTNSYEAVSKLEHSKRSITIHSAIWNDSWLDVSIKNPFDHAINKGLKSSKLNHDGLGVNQIKKIVEEHDGLIKFEVFDQQFEVLISIPINN